MSQATTLSNLIAITRRRTRTFEQAIDRYSQLLAWLDDARPLATDGELLAKFREVEAEAPVIRERINTLQRYVAGEGVSIEEFFRLRG